MQVSPHQVTLYRRCKRLIGFEYVERLKAPPSEKQTFGSQIHDQLEKWLRLAKPPGEVARTGLKWLPTPDESLLIEHKINFEWLPGIYMIGIIDCASQVDSLVIDHKTTSDLRWAMTTDQLFCDPQAIIYAVWAMLTWNQPIVKARWVYYAASNPPKGARRSRGSKPVEVIYHNRDQKFISQVGRITEDVRAIVDIRRQMIKGMDLEPTPGSCNSYGGCFHQERCQLSTDEVIDRYFS